MIDLDFLDPFDPDSHVLAVTVHSRVESVALSASRGERIREQLAHETPLEHRSGPGLWLVTRRTATLGGESTVE